MSVPDPNKETPAMRQYFGFKKQYPDCVLFFRMGDFYEMFYDDAKLAHKVLGVTLTQRTAGVPMAGVPYHAVENYLRRMIQAGYRVAVCDQMESPAQAKGVVRRDVTRFITPGTLTDDSLLEEGRENPLAAVLFHDDTRASAAWAELSTGSFRIATLSTAELADELARLGPREILYVESADGQPPGRIKELAQHALSAAGNASAAANATGMARGALTARPAWQFRQDEAVETLRKQFQVATLAGFGLAEDDPALGPASAIVHYLLETQRAVHAVNTSASSEASETSGGGSGGGASGGGRIAHLLPPRRFERSDHLIIDQVSLRSLEVERTLRSGSTEGSLLGVLQECATPMGKRTLRHWLCYPLRQRGAIEKRQRSVAALVADSRFLDELRTTLADIQDVERIVGRIAVGRASPRDLTALGASAAQATALAQLLAGQARLADEAKELASIAAPMDELAKTVAAACVDSPPQHLRDGGLIRDGHDARLDECRGLQRDSNAWLAQYQKQLIEKTGIASLKVGFNQVFGFYIEVSAARAGQAPVEWSRKQTLKNAERYITPELKDYEGKVLTARDRAAAREQELFAELCAAAAAKVPDLHCFAQAVAALDVLACFARRAVRHRYVCPQIVDEPVLRIAAGRHPVLDEILGDRFVPNDVELGSGIGYRVSGIGKKKDNPPAVVPESSTRDPIPETRGPIPALTQTSLPGGLKPQASLALITGPNMAGKSTYIRQAALITLMAHAGSFVPAEQAVVGLCDRIFTRIGAADELHAGASTFMVEMTETANICHHATPGSLVILDEIGRGTSTLDGLSLAWAIAEHLAARGCRTLFATHYHELTTLAQTLPAVANLNVTVREWQDQIVFLHRIVPGATDRSYGIHVAKIAGLPPEVVKRANQLLGQLTVSHETTVPARQAKAAAAQMGLFTEYLDHPVLTELKEADLDSLTPLQAFDLLRRLREQSRQPT